MKRIHKFISLAAISALALTGLAGCGTNNGGGSTPAATTATNVTLSVWGPSEDQADANSWLPKQEAAFQQAHPEWKITWKNSTVPEDQAATTVKQDPSAAADVYMFANDQLGALVEANAIGKLPQAGIDQVKQQNSDVMIKSVTGADGQIYGVPYTANTWFMYYNKSKFTSDDIKSLDAMLEKGKVSISLDDGWYLASFYVGNGNTLFGADGTDEAAGFDFGGAKGADVTAYLAGLAKNPNFVNNANGAGLAGIQNGTVDAYFSGSWDAAAVKAALGDNYAAAQPPTFTVNGQPVQMKAFAGSKAAAFNPNASNPQVASTFAAFLGSASAQQDHYTMRGIIPSDKTLASDSTISADPVAVAQMDTVANASVLQPSFPAMGNFWDPAKAFGQAILSGDVTVDNAAEKTEAWNAGYAA